MDAFDRYIDSLGQLDDDDLFMTIDETMALRDEERIKESDHLKSYTSKCKKKYCGK